MEGWDTELLASIFAWVIIRIISRKDRFSKATSVERENGNFGDIPELKLERTNDLFIG